MISGASVITCDNTDYVKSFKDEDRKGLVFSVPFYGPDGRFKGVVAAIIRDNALRKLLPEKEFALVNSRYGIFLPSVGGITDKTTAERARSGQADPSAIYSELLPLQVNDPQSKWWVSANAADATFYKGAEYRAVRSFRYLGIFAVLILAAAASAGVWVANRNALTKKRSELQRQQDESLRSRSAKEQEQAAKQGLAIPAEPLYFIKAASSYLAHGQTIEAPASYDGRVVYEGELGLVIGKEVIALVKSTEVAIAAL